MRIHGTELGTETWLEGTLMFTLVDRVQASAVDVRSHVECLKQVGNRRFY
jgi:hypothetical protein